jgi:hypothetical protein
MRPVAVIEILELAQGMEQVTLVPDQRPIQQLASAGLLTKRCALVSDTLLIAHGRNDSFREIGQGKSELTAAASRSRACSAAASDVIRKTVRRRALARSADAPPPTRGVAR